MVPGFDPMLLLVLNLAGTFAFGLSGGMAGVRERLDLFGVVVLVVDRGGGVREGLAEVVLEARAEQAPADGLRRRVAARAAAVRSEAAPPAVASAAQHLLAHPS